MQAFNLFQIRTDVSDIGFHGNSFTWSNNQSGANRVWERLDRVLINGIAMAARPCIRVEHLPRICLDHCPLLVHSKPSAPRKGFFDTKRCGKIMITLRRL